jgi:hypothetical protein
LLPLPLFVLCRHPERSEGSLYFAFVFCSCSCFKKGNPMGLDIRIPLGLIFLIIGGMMSLFGFITRGTGIYQRSMGINLNLTWGALMFVFGLIMFLIGRRQKWQDDPVNPRPWEKSAGPRH